jgi:hypothetical protein
MAWPWPRRQCMGTSSSLAIWHPSMGQRLQYSSHVQEGIHYNSRHMVQVHLSFISQLPQEVPTLGSSFPVEGCWCHRRLPPLALPHHWEQHPHKSWHLGR